MIVSTKQKERGVEGGEKLKFSFRRIDQRESNVQCYRGDVLTSIECSAPISKLYRGTFPTAVIKSTTCYDGLVPCVEE